MLPRRRHPLWFDLVLAVAFCIAMRALGAWLDPSGVAGQDGAPFTVAFWALIAAVAQAIWKGFEVAGRVTLEVLKWSVLQLWAFARSTYNGLIGVGKDLVRGIRRAWDFLEATYAHVLKPAWEHFWKWFERARRWLEDIFRPVFDFLQTIRKWVLDFYTRYVRPILDVLGIAQRVLRVLEAFGFEWARRLDGYLSELQRRIDAPFRLVLAKINQIVNIVNRVVTADGLFQRVALVRTIERDVRHVSRAFVNWRERPLLQEEWDDLQRRMKLRTDEDLRRDFEASVSRDAAASDPIIAEIVAQWRLDLKAK